MLHPHPHRIAWLAAVAAVLLAPGDARAYTLKHTADGQLVRWNAPEIVLCVARSVPGHGPRRADVRRAAVMAAETWSEVPGAPTVRVLEHPCELGVLDGVNTIGVAREWTHGARLAVTQSHYTADGRLLEADVMINGSLTFAMIQEREEADGFDLPSVLTHELGHVLGLDESAAPAAVMWPTTRPGETHQRELAPDDVDAVLALYGGEAAATGAFASYGCAAAPRPLPMSWAWPLAVVAISFARRRRRPAR